MGSLCTAWCVRRQAPARVCTPLKDLVDQHSSFVPPLFTRSNTADTPARNRISQRGRDASPSTPSSTHVVELQEAKNLAAPTSPARAPGPRCLDESQHQTEAHCAPAALRWGACHGTFRSKQPPSQRQQQKRICRTQAWRSSFATGGYGVNEPFRLHIRHHAHRRTLCQHLCASWHLLRTGLPGRLQCRSAAAAQGGGSNDGAARRRHRAGRRQFAVIAWGRCGRQQWGC